MEELRVGMSPIFPVEKDVDVSSDAEPLSRTSSIQVFIRLAEPVVFLQGFNQAQQSEAPPSMLRGSLVVRVLKPSKLKSISLSFKGYSRTEWPEGIPPRRQEFVESSDIVNHVWPFYQNDGTTTNGGLGPSDDYSYLLRKSGASVYKRLEMVRNRSRSFSGDSPTSDFNIEAEHGGINHHVGGRKRSNSNTGSLGLGFSSHPKEGSPGSTSNRTLSPMSMLRKVTSASSNKHEKSSNLITDLLTSTFSNSNDQNSRSRRNSVSSVGGDNGVIGSGSGTGSNHLTLNFDSGITSGSGDHFVFQPGDYIYTFEQAIPSSYPETIKADFGFVEYYLHANIERVGAFKSNIAARLPVPLIRTQSDLSVEETEPIAISRDWEDQLHYDIVIASKDIILDAFLPIAFHFAPLDKVTLHRIRIYLTETMEYYCRGKKVHRMEPTKKLLLTEHNGPSVADPDDKSSLKAKNMGNLLLEESSGDLVNKDYEYQVYIPSMASGRRSLHPDTSFDKIKSNHWIKLCLRLSKMVDGKRKHYEISIDSPIHVLHKLCSHANTLLPSYDSHTFTNEKALSTCPKFGNTENVNIYHDSNIFFPKEVLLSPVVSPEVHPMDSKLTSNSRNSSQLPFRARDSRKSRTMDEYDSTFNSPRLRSNIYQPETIRRELASPQAIPLSPVASPLLGATLWQDAPPTFDFEGDDLSLSRELPPDPPLYADVLRYEELERRQRSSITSKTPDLPKITLNRSNEEEPTLDEQLATDSFLKGNNPRNAREGLQASFRDGDKEEDDIAFGFNFQGRSEILPSSLGSSVRSPAVCPVSTERPSKPSLPVNGLSDRDSKIPSLSPPFSSTLPTTTTEPKQPTKRSLATSTLPATVRNDTSSFSGLGEILGETPQKGFPLNGTNADEKNDSHSNSSLLGRSSLDTVSASLSNENMVPLSQRVDNGFHGSTDNFSTQSRDSTTTCAGHPGEPSMDATAYYDRNSNPWHPLQRSVSPDFSHVIGPHYSSNVINRNHVGGEFKGSFPHSYGSQDLGIGDAKQARHLGNPFCPPKALHRKREQHIGSPASSYGRFSPEKQLVNEIGTEATSAPEDRSLFC